jgi:hypothetical protein
MLRYIFQAIPEIPKRKEFEGGKEFEGDGRMGNVGWMAPGRLATSFGNY